MVVTVRLSKEAAEMMRSHKKLKSRSSEAATASRLVSAIASVAGTPPHPTHPPSPSHRTPVNASWAPTRGCDHRDNPSSSPMYSSHMSTSPISTSPISTSTLSLPQPSPIRLNPRIPNSCSLSRQEPEGRTANAPPPPRSWPSKSPPRQQQHQQQPPHRRRHPLVLSPPSTFGEEDYGRLAGCIENMDSMGSVEAEAASRATADAIAPGALERTGSNESILMSSPSPSRDDDADDDDAPPSPSGHRHHPSSPEPFVLHPIHGPSAVFQSSCDCASFAITPSGASMTENNTDGVDDVDDNNGGGYSRAYNTSPNSLNWEECIDHLFDDLANGRSPGRGKNDDSLADHPPVEARSIDKTGATSNARSFMLKRRKGEAFWGGGRGDEIEYGRECRRRRMDDDENSSNSSSSSNNNNNNNNNKNNNDNTSINNKNNKKTNIDGGSRIFFGNDGFFHSVTDAPIQSLHVDFGSMLKSSTEVANRRGTSRTTERLFPRPPIKTAIIFPLDLPPGLSARDRPPSTRTPPPLQASPSFDDDLMADPLHPSMGTLERYDNELYRMLRDAYPTPALALPRPLVPHHATGNRLTVVRGPSRSCTDFEVEDCVASRAYAFKKFLREVQLAFEGCTYLLPGFRGGVSDWGENINVSSFGSFVLGHIPGRRKSDQVSKLNEMDLTIARRRVHCAIHAFGGRVNRRRSSKENGPGMMSIFRTRNGSSSVDQSLNKVASESGSSRSSSSSSSSSISSSTKTNRQMTRTNSIVRREKYEGELRKQYFEHGNRLSWDVEENLSLTLTGASTFEDNDITFKQSDSNLSDDKQHSSRKNRCKKCGQVKLGHVCPYLSSLLRNIGIMVYPSANAHVADEPGKLAPALCEMNNFISIKSGSFEVVADDRKKLTADSTTVGDKNEFPRRDLISAISPFRRKTHLGSPTATSDPFDRSNSGEQRTHDLLFQPKMEITPDQYRSVTRRDSSTVSRRDYSYPHVPLTFEQRKSASDALFSLSKLVPTLTDECAIVLTEARERDQWDLAVAELMTQVICVLHCSPTNDYTLEGLRRYLLMLGIVC